MKFIYKRSEYVADGSTAIMAYDEDGFPYGDVTVCLVEYGMVPPNENYIFVPKYKITNEFYKVLSRDLFKEVISEIPIGFGKGELVKLKDNWKELCEVM